MRDRDAQPCVITDRAADPGEARQGEIQGHRRDDRRRDHRQEDKADHERREPRLDHPHAEREGERKSGCDRAADDADAKAQENAARPVRIVDQLAIMDERQMAVRHREEARGRERDRHNRKQRREQESADEASEQKRDPARALDHREPPMSAGLARRNNAAMRTPTVATNATLIAAPSPQSGLWNMRNQTRSAAMRLRPPPRMAGVTKKPRVKTKTMSAAPTTPEV